MQKMQILFPEPQLAQLRRIASSQDRPVSELVRLAVDFWLSRYGAGDSGTVSEQPPVYSCGEVLKTSQELRDTAYSDQV